MRGGRLRRKMRSKAGSIAMRARTQTHPLFTPEMLKNLCSTIFVAGLTYFCYMTFKKPQAAGKKGKAAPKRSASSVGDAGWDLPEAKSGGKKQQSKKNKKKKA